MLQDWALWVLNFKFEENKYSMYKLIQKELYWNKIPDKKIRWYEHDYQYTLENMLFSL